MAHRKKPSRTGTRTGGRMLREQVRTAAKRSASSTRWLERQLNDPYVVEARRLGLRSRAAFKLMQLDDRFQFLAPGRRVVDLGAAPGGWSQVAAERVRAGSPQSGRVVAIDILEWTPVPNTISIVRDFLDPEAPKLIIEALAGPADVVLSDMAAPTTGHGATDHLRIVALVEVAFEFAVSILGPGGSFVAKVFQGGTERALLEQMKRRFASVRHAKPAASRAGSAETYVVAQGFRTAP